MEVRPRKAKQKRGAEEALGLEELNLVEFPLVVLADRAPSGQKSLEFSDSIFDKASGDYVERQCIVTGSDKWGLPNWFDMDVLLALMKITNDQHRFRERLVTFSFYLLLQELGIKKYGGKDVKRLVTSLLRILGTTVAYTNGWREKGKWKSLEAFHLVDNVRLTNTLAQFDPDEEQHFKWNDVVVESVQRSNAKTFDWEFYCSLERPSAKRLYRFLSKRFHLKSSWRFELTSFCENKVGMKANQPAWRYRDKLKPGYVELVRAGFLSNTDEAFSKEGRVSFVNFQIKRQLRTGKKVVSAKEREPTPLETLLLDRGVKNAAELVSEHAAEKIKQQVENFDDRKSHGDEKGPGWLRRAIESEDGFGFRNGYKPKAEREALKRKKEEELRKQEKANAEEQKRIDEDRRLLRARLESVEGYLETLSDVEEEALLVGVRGSLSKSEVFGFDRMDTMKKEYIYRHLVEAGKVTEVR